jgi:hypothetical protein
VVVPGLGFPGGGVSQAIGDKIGQGLQFLHDFDRNQRRLKTGGNYEDTEAAYTMRQAACNELSGSLLNARQWLGREGAMMHV